MAAVLSRSAPTVARAGVRCASIDATAVRFTKNGFPTQVLRVEKFKLDTASMKSNEAVVKMVAAPITPIDLAQVSGFAGKASGSRIGGNEGLGVVEEAGAGSGLKKGDMVAINRPGIGTWSTHIVAPAEALTVVTAPGKDTLEAAAASVVPVLAAQHLLGLAALSKGDTIVQNNASSTVGQIIVQLAAKQGLRSINIMPGHSKWAELVSHLQALGATTVVSDDQAASFEFVTKVLADLPAAKLGLNSAGGASASAVAKALAPGSTLVTFGSRSGRPVSAPLSWFTAKDLTLKGFSLSAKTAKMSKADLDKAVKEAVSSVSTGNLKLLVAREPFADFPIALKRALTPEERKVVLHF